MITVQVVLDTDDILGYISDMKTLRELHNALSRQLRTVVGISEDYPVNNVELESEYVLRIQRENKWFTPNIIKMAYHYKG